MICPHCSKIVEKNKKEKEGLCPACQKTLKLNEAYFLLEVLGENKAKTYLAENLNGEKCIIKELNMLVVENWKVYELFEREIKALASLEHEKIPKFLDHFKREGEGFVCYYLVMEYVSGKTLKDLLNERSYNESEVKSIILEIATILESLHQLNPPIIHRDIKPSNIIQSKKGLVLIDLGAVTDVLKPDGGSTIAGSFGYMAPEQFMGKAVQASDYYGLGMTALALLTKKDMGFLQKNVKKLIDSLKLQNEMTFLLYALTEEKAEERIKSKQGILHFFNKFKDKEFGLSNQEIMAFENKIKEQVENELIVQYKREFFQEKFEEKAETILRKYKDLDSVLEDMKRMPVKKEKTIFKIGRLLISKKHQATKRLDLYLEAVKARGIDLEDMYLYLYAFEHQEELNIEEDHFDRLLGKMGIKKGDLFLYKKWLLTLKTKHLNKKR